MVHQLSDFIIGEKYEESMSKLLKKKKKSKEIIIDRKVETQILVGRFSKV